MAQSSTITGRVSLLGIYYSYSTNLDAVTVMFYFIAAFSIDLFESLFLSDTSVELALWILSFLLLGGR